MQRTAVISATVAAALASGAVLAVSGGAQTPARSTIHLVTKNCSIKYFDVAPRSLARPFRPGAADTVSLVCRAENAAGVGQGNVHASGQYTRGGRLAAGVTHGLYRLNDGEVYFLAKLSASANTSGAVVGGTGAYAGARGTFKSIARPGQRFGGVADDTITLLQ